MQSDVFWVYVILVLEGCWRFELRNFDTVVWLFLVLQGELGQAYEGRGFAIDICLMVFIRIGDRAFSCVGDKEKHEVVITACGEGFL